MASWWLHSANGNENVKIKMRSWKSRSFNFNIFVVLVPRNEEVIETMWKTKDKKDSINVYLVPNYLFNKIIPKYKSFYKETKNIIANNKLTVSLI